jgi:hypothetical protein
MGHFKLGKNYHKERVNATCEKCAHTLLNCAKLSCVLQATAFSHRFFEVFIKSEPDRPQDADANERSKTA